MKVAIVSEWVDAWRGGAETSTLQFVHRLIDEGVEVHLYTRSRPSPTPEFRVHAISGAAMGRTRKTVTFTHRVDRILRSQSFDVIHAISPCRTAHLYQPRSGTVAETIQRNVALRGNAATRSFKRYAARFNFKQRFMLRLERDLIRNPSGPIIVALSDYVVRQLREHYGLEDRRIRKVFNGIDPNPSTAEERMRDRAEVRQEFQIGEGDLLGLVIAHNFRLKGVEAWMHAVAQMSAEGIDNVKTIVVGKGDSEKWRQKARRLNVEQRVIFAGPSDRVPRFRHAADFGVHLSYYDPCSRVVLEALADGLPCIASAWDGASELIRDGQSGFVISNPDDLAAIQQSVSKLGDPELRKRMGEAAREASSPYTMAHHAQQMLDLYEEVASAGVVP
ncbi:MAG: glycosyltransferase family 4 protein [Planctomycetota bacterium]